jgi:hypothetical protein
MDESRIGKRRWRAVSSKYEYGSRLSVLWVKSIKTDIPDWTRALIVSREDSSS